MKIINRQHETYNDSEYVISTGWGFDCDIRFEIYDESGNWWDIFLDLDEMEFMHEFIELFLKNEKIKRNT